MHRLGFVTNCFGPSAMAAAPDDIATLKAALAAAERRADRAEAEVANSRAKASHAEALIAHLTLEIEKLKRELYGTHSEKKARLLDQLEMQLEDAQAAATEDELAAEQAAAKTTSVQAFIRKRPSKKPFLEHLPRERVVVPEGRDKGSNADAEDGVAPLWEEIAVVRLAGRREMRGPSQTGRGGDKTMSETRSGPRIGGTGHQIQKG